MKSVIILVFNLPALRLRDQSQYDVNIYYYGEHFKLCRFQLEQTFSQQAKIQIV